MILPIVFAASLCSAPGWQATMEGLRKAWSLSPADAARRDLWESRKLSKGPVRILVRADSGKDGSVKSVEWSAETGVRAHDLPDETFWAILDGTSLDAEWTEADPDGLPKSYLKTLDVPPAQSFLCRSCKPRLAATTFARHGTTSLRIASLTDAATTISVGLAAGITEDGLRSLAAQRSLSIDAANPCKDKSGICVMEMSGPAGQKWIVSRHDGKSSWNSLEASYQAGAWWSPEWDWDSLRIQSPREFKSVIGDWIGSEADVLAEKLLAPVEPILAFPVSSWKTREIPGLRVRQVSDSVAKLAGPPPGLVLARTERLFAQIDAFGRRIVKLGDFAK